MTTRRSLLAGAGAAAAFWRVRRVHRRHRAPMAAGLSDPTIQPKFQQIVLNALDPALAAVPVAGNAYQVFVGQTVQYTGLVNARGRQVPTTVWGYGQGRGAPSWPGVTFTAQKNRPISVRWENKLLGRRGPLPHFLPVDRSFHYAFSLPGYEGYSIDRHGVPIVTHLHGGQAPQQSDGFPEAFFTPNFQIKGPSWVNATYVYPNTQQAGHLWYHDHTLGMTRVNVYAGLAGFYLLRDSIDTGDETNAPGLPSGDQELGYVIQDRMFRDDGSLFFPAFPGEPFWSDYITGQGLADEDVPQPSGLAEFFGDHIVVNGSIWPKTHVEPRAYRLRMLNGCDSRFLVLQFRAVPMGATALDNAGAPLPFYVVGSDQGLARAATETDTLIIGPGERYDLVVDFAQAGMNRRVVMTNLGGDSPFGGAFGDKLAPEDVFADRQTDRIMAFDIVRPRRGRSSAFDPGRVHGQPHNTRPVDRVRKVALFEGTDEFGRIQPMLGVAGPTIDVNGDTVDGSLTWHMATTENPAAGSTEIWEIYNGTEDAHPIHLHAVDFEVLNRQDFTADLVDAPIVLHNGSFGLGARLENITLTGAEEAPETYENAPKDMVTVYPGQLTRIKVTFGVTGTFVWHCHILSHEDHDMMRRLKVG